MDEGHDLAKLRKFPHPYQAGLTVASDIDNASFNRFAAIHALFCGSEVIGPASRDWETLALSKNSIWYDSAAGGVRGLGLELADSFFMIPDEVTMGMYRYDTGADRFTEDVSDGHNACEVIQDGLKRGQIDSFHTFLHYPREKVLPLLTGLYRWCEEQSIRKPMVWINHSCPVTPTGLCPDRLRPNRAVSLARMLARWTIGPLLGRARRPLRHAFAWYHGDSPGSKYYINDVLSANGLRYVWLCAGDDTLPNVICLPERSYGDQSSMLDVVTMDDGVKYFQFRRCYGRVDAPAGFGCCLRQDKTTIDASALFSEENLDRLCREAGTCILYTHWTLARSFPIQDTTITHFDTVRRYRDEGKIWVARVSKLLEWTRIRTFLQYIAKREADGLVIDIAGVDDPVCGKSQISPEDCRGLSFEIPEDVQNVTIRFGQEALASRMVRRDKATCWIDERDL